MPWLRLIAARALAAVVPVVLAVWQLGVIDLLAILWRGGSVATAPPVHVLLVGAGVVLGAAAWPVVEAVNGLGHGLRWVLGKLGRQGPAPSRWPAALIALVLVWRLTPAHDEFTIHHAGTALMTAYAVVPAVLVAVWVDRLRVQAQGWGWRRRGLFALLGVGLAVGLHLVNARTLIGLYVPLHRGLSEGTLAALLATAVVALSGVRLRVRLGALAVLAGTAAAMAPVVHPGPARPGVMFLGTELRHIAEAVEPAFDRDGDGVPPAPYGGDCDDTDPAVHPLAIEVAGNGKDDNCRLGDRAAGAERPLRPAPTPPGLAAWRAAHPKPNVLLVFIDTWRWDYLEPSLTPALSELAAKSTVFTQARTTAPRTPLAWMSLLRGRFLGRCLRCRARLLAPGKATLPHRLKAAGYQTYGRFVGKSWKRYHGVGGFVREHQASSVQKLHAHRVVADVRRWLRALQAKPEPFFLLGHFADPHAPYKPNDLFEAGEGMRGAYAAEVRYTDHQVGRLLHDLKRFGRMDDTIVAVFADHGENLGEHGDAGGHHGVSLFDEVIRVPMFIYVPGVAPRTVSDPVSLVDLAPTLLELTGAPPLPAADGRSLAGYLFDAPPPPAPTVSEFYNFGHRLRAVVHGRFKLIHDAHHDVRLLYDVVGDPEERDDLLAARPEVAAELQGWLDAWVERGADVVEARPQRCKGLVPLPKRTLESAKAKRDKARKKEKR